jgi:hypothetical protein
VTELGTPSKPKKDIFPNNLLDKRSPNDVRIKGLATAGLESVMQFDDNHPNLGQP